MKNLLITVLLLSGSLIGFAQQRSLCQLFILGFNQANQDFPFIKPAPYDSINNGISKDTLNLYGLSSGFISRQMNIKSNNYPGYTYSSHNLYLYGPGQFIDASSFEQIKDNAYTAFTKFCNGYGNTCLSELVMSEIYTNEKFPEDADIWVCFFYPKMVNVPTGTSLSEIVVILNEIPCIEIKFRKRFIRKGYEMAFNIQGIQYNKN